MSGRGSRDLLFGVMRGLAVVIVIAAGLLVATVARAEQLPLTHFTSEDGLPSDLVHCALQDRQGFLWFGTAAGLSRFDGSAFRNFGTREGSELVVLSLVEEEGGALVVGTQDAAYLFDPAGGGRFRKILSIPAGGEGVHLLRDGAGRIWAGADGLYRLEREGGEPVFRRVSNLALEAGTPALALAADRRGNLWIGSHGLHGISAKGRPLLASTPPGFGLAAALAIDAEGNLWAGFAEGICRIEGSPAPSDGSASECRRVSSDALGYRGGLRIIPRAGSGLWAGTQKGLHEIDRDGRLVRSITRAEGLPKSWAYPLLVDGLGDVWITLVHDGIARLRLSGLTSYGVAEGLEQMSVSSILKAQSGETVVFGSDHVLYVFDGRGFHPVRPNLQGISFPGWGWYQYDLQDHEGDWWIPTDQGIYRLAAVPRLADVARAPLKAVYTKKDGLPSDNIFRLFEDSRGDIWVSVLRPASSGPAARRTLSRWERATNRFHSYGEDHGVTESCAPTAFLEMPDGSLWIGFSEGGRVYRYQDGRIERLGFEGALEGAFVSAFLRDAGGRVWIATRGAGVCRVDDPGAGRPGCLRLTVRDGLASDEVNGMAEDARGRIYLGGGRGVDILEGGKPIRHLGRSDGLPRSYVSAVFGDSLGGIWFGTLNGLARLEPHGDDRAPMPARVRIDGLRVGGLPRALSALGEASIGELILGHDERRLQIDYVGLSLAEGETLRFQHRLAGSEPWSEPSPERTLLLPNLSPGRYRLEVRAVDPAGRSPSEPAVVAFRVLAPVWRRPWFVGLAAAAVVAGAFAGYRLRMAHLMALQRQRMRIAMDLHDNLGSGLGSIGVLADLAAEPELESPRRRDLLDQIATTASELGTAMGDIVWSLRTGADSLEALAIFLSERGRRLFPEGGALLRTRFPASWPEARLSLAARYNLAMIGLEAMHNAAKHSGASEVILDLRPEEGRWRLSVADNGSGLKAAGPETEEMEPGEREGLGFASMRRRAEEIGAGFRVEPGAGQGTTITVLFDPDAQAKPRLI